MISSPQTLYAAYKYTFRLLFNINGALYLRSYERELVNQAIETNIVRFKSAEFQGYSPHHGSNRPPTLANYSSTIVGVND